MPAAAVTPAPQVYINSVAVKTLVVGFWRVDGVWSALYASTGAGSLYVVTM